MSPRTRACRSEVESNPPLDPGIPVRHGGMPLSAWTPAYSHPTSKYVLEFHIDIAKFSDTHWEECPKVGWRLESQVPGVAENPPK